MRLVLLLVQLRKSTRGVKLDIVEALYLLRKSPRLLQVRSSQIDGVCVGEKHLADLKMGSRFDLLRQRRKSEELWRDRVTQTEHCCSIFFFYRFQTLNRFSDASRIPEMLR